MDEKRIEAPKSASRLSLVIAVDGPAASGKGTLARKLAEHFGVAYLDTGRLYRAVGWKVLQSGHDPENAAYAVNAAKTLSNADILNPGLFSEEVGNAASIVSAIPSVRQALFDFQQNFSRQPGGAVLDGRDIGTVICPGADVKLFVTASLEARAKRRFNELKSHGMNVTLEGVFDNLKERDQRDARRSVAPLIPAEDAWQVDTTELGIEEVFQAVLNKIQHMKTAKNSTPRA